jgi:threonine aldolase
MRIVDLRSDTITKPTPAMRRAMAEAEVGDDVFGEDPTVNRLEEISAELIGKEAALFVASGTMGNLVSLLAQCGRGDEIILGDQSHTFFYEQGGTASLGGIHPRTVSNQADGKIRLQDIENAIRPENVHFCRTKLIALENTHNRCYGTPLDKSYLHAVAELAGKYNLKLHIDGARIFNAATALGTSVRELAAEADSVSFCLSKGLAAPAGSVVCGDKDFIAEARRARKVLGGGMRQAGVLAAAGIVALNEMTERLAEDHQNARNLAAALANVKELTIDIEMVKTNIVFLDVAENYATAQELAEVLAEEGVRVLPTGPQRLRAVTQYHISQDDIEYTLSAFEKVLG